MTANPLLALEAHEFPAFDAIAPEHVAPAIGQLIAENRALVEKLTISDEKPAAPDWANFVAPLDEASEWLGRAWGIVSHLHGVLDTAPWREAYNAVLPEISAFYAEMGQNLALFKGYRAVAENPAFAQESAVRQRIIEHALRDFRLSGAELPEADKPRFAEIQQEMAALAAKFSENLLDATNAYVEWIDDEAALAGIPEDARAAAAAAAREDGREGCWKFTLHMPSYLPVMQYADNRALRERLYRAYATRASEHGPKELDNSDIIVRILQLRAEEARMLGYANYAEVSLAPKMAESTAQVLEFLRDIARRARPYAERDLAELREFARRELGLEELAAWDIAWASEKLRQARYAFSEHEVKQYFPEPKVTAGLFAAIGRLYGVELQAADAPRWHPDVRFFALQRGGQTIGHFWMDLFARPTKRGGAWMDSARSRWRRAGALQTPQAYLVCNFSAPQGDTPATFRHDDVLTLFHECGHGLHHLLTEVDEVAASGISGVEWDAVELPSQFMENFCWDYGVLAAMSRHVETAEPLPRALFDKMFAARNFQRGLAMVRQIEFSLFDFLLHCRPAPQAIREVQALIDEVRREVAVLIPPEWHRFAHSFSHIFAGGYAAGYYSYKWAEVLSADAFAAFEEAAEKNGGNLLDAETGRRFQREILAVGSARPAIESFRAFRGRDPQIDALLRHNGMDGAARAA